MLILTIWIILFVERQWRSLLRKSYTSSSSVAVSMLTSVSIFLRNNRCVDVRAKQSMASLLLFSIFQRPCTSPSYSASWVFWWWNVFVAIKLFSHCRLYFHNRLRFNENYIKIFNTYFDLPSFLFHCFVHERLGEMILEELSNDFVSVAKVLENVFTSTFVFRNILE